MKNELRKRLGPFLALLDAKYLPLLAAVAPQAYNVYLWLWRHSDASTEAQWFAVVGAVGFELVYVGAIAWAEEGKSSGWTWITAGMALLFSIGVAVYVNLNEGYWAILHAGFPLVAFAYTINMYVATTRRSVQPATETVQLVDTPQPPQLTTGATVELKPAQGKLAGIDVVAELAKHGGSKSVTATALGVSRAGLDKALGRTITR